MLANVSHRTLRKMSYLSDQKGIIKRYMREKNKWNSHLDNSKKFILKSIENHSKNSIAILGSGWGLDVPFKELSELYEKVYLIDIFHPSEIKKAVHKYPNINLIDADISNGMIEFTYNFVKEHKKQKNDFPIADYLNQIPKINLDEFDTVVSLNILNQLDILLIDYLQKYFILSEDQIIEIRKYIQDYHIEMLPAKKSILITDFEEHLLDRKGEIKEIKKSIFTDKINLNKADKWIWNFDSKKTYYDEYNLDFNVLALRK